MRTVLFVAGLVLVSTGVQATPKLQTKRATPVAARLGQQLAVELADLENVEIRVTGNDVIVDGDVETQDQFERVTIAVARANARLGAASGRQIVIPLGKSITIEIPFAIRKGLNSNPAVVEGHFDGPSQLMTFFAKQEGEATYTLFDAKNKKRILELDIRVIGD